MLIAMTGRAQAGKDTCFERIAAIADDDVVVRLSFADKLYASAAAALGVTPEQLLAWKTAPVRIEIVKYQDRPGRRMRGGSRLHKLNVRQYLQWYGTEAHREVFGTNFWVDAASLEHEGQLVVVTDCRFENEAKAVRAAGGRVVRVVGPDEVEDVNDTHASEAGLPDELIDAELDNSVRDDNYASLDAQLSDLLQGGGRVDES